MPSLIDSGKVVGPGPVSLKQTARDCNLQFPLSLRQFLDTPGCPFSLRIRLHIKVLTAPTVAVDAMLRAMREIFSTADMRVEVVSRESLTALTSTALNDLDVGACTSPPTAEQTALFMNRNNVDDGDIVIYFVQGTGPKFDGCAIHPPNQDGAVIDQVAVVWVLAHEVGHVLGLGHIGGENCGLPAGSTGGPSTTSLMSQCWLGFIVGTPTVAASEINIMRTNRTNSEAGPVLVAAG